MPNSGTNNEAKANDEAHASDEAQANNETQANGHAQISDAAAQQQSQAVSLDPRKRLRSVLATVDLTFCSDGRRKGGEEGRKESLVGGQVAEVDQRRRRWPLVVLQLRQVAELDERRR